MNVYSDKNRHPCAAVIEGDWVVIAIHKSNILSAVSLHPELEQYDEELDKYVSPIITDLDLFIQDVVNALNQEAEDGSTPITHALDEAILEAVENGSEGIEVESD